MILATRARCKAAYWSDRDELIRGRGSFKKQRVYVYNELFLNGLSVTEYHEIACPGCGTTHRYPATLMSAVHSCSCGATCRIDTDDWVAIEIVI
jgi:hypothetical protein